MDTSKIRIIFLVVLALLFSLLLSKWQAKYAPNPSAEPIAPQAQTSTKEQPQLSLKDSAPTLQPSAAQAKVTPAKHADKKAGVIKVSTNLFNVELGKQGGNVIAVELKKYPETLHSKEPYQLLTNQPDDRYVAQSGLINPILKNAHPIFSAEKTHYDIKDGNELKVDLTWQNSDFKIIKTYTFFKDRYVIHVNYHIENLTQKAQPIRFYAQLIRKEVEKSHGFLGSYVTFTGAAISSQEKNYKKVSFKDMANEPVNITTTGGWAAMVQHYFLGAWIPNQRQSTEIYSQSLGNNNYSIGIANPAQTIAAGKSIDTGAELYTGPIVKDRLDKVAPHLSLTIDYGWLFFISDIVFWAMKWLHQILGNWGWAIIFTTVLIKILFYPLSAKSYRSMAKMRELQPKMQQLKERFKDDRQKMGQATMELYRKEKVNPLGGCLPMLIQIPVFIGLYWVLIESVELRQAPFIFWIQDLSMKDPFYILPVLMGLSMFAQQRLNPAPPDPTQAKVMMFMPVVFTIMFLNFPSGLVLYWLVNNLISIAQQAWITHKVANEPKNKKHK